MSKPEDSRQPADSEDQSSSVPFPEGGGADDQLAALQAERDNFYQNWLRSQADFDNYRKRAQKELEQERQYAVLPLVRDLLPALDNLDRTLEAAAKSNDLAQLTQGVEMVKKQFEGLLAKNNVQRIKAVGKPFDPHLHQAMQQIPTADHPPMTVLQEYERGYTLNERVVRPSTVVVSAPPAS
jgi:molecular chaperone GrpE